MAVEEPQYNFAKIGDEILQAALARTIATSVIEAQAYRVSGSCPSSSKPKAKNRARKEVTQLEQRQYRHQFLEAKMSEHKSWLDNDVYDLVDMSKHPPKNFVKGRWVLTVKRDRDGKFVKCKARWVLKGFQDKQKLDQQTDSPTSTRPGFRMTCQLAANKGWDFPIDLKTAFCTLNPMMCLGM